MARPRKTKPAPRKPQRRGGNYRDNTRAAMVLAEAHFYGGKISVAKKYGVPEATYFRWENALETDEQLTALYYQHLEALKRFSWAEDLNAAKRQILARLVEVVSQSERLEEITAVLDKAITWTERHAVIEIETRAAGQDLLPAGEEERPEAPRHRA